jgi:transposase
MFAAGKLILSSIARELKVSRQSVSRWYAEWKKGGNDAPRGAGRAGRKSGMAAGQLLKVERALRKGPRAHH